MAQLHPDWRLGWCLSIVPCFSEASQGQFQKLIGTTQEPLAARQFLGEWEAFVRPLFSHKEMEMLQLQFSAHSAPWEQLRKHLVCACLKPCLLLRIGQGSRTQWDRGDSWCPSTQTTHLHMHTDTHVQTHKFTTQTHAKMYNFTLIQIHTYVQTHKITHT